MKSIETPVYRLTAKSILRSFQISHKKHILITGSIGAGKSTLAQKLIKLLCGTEKSLPVPGFTTHAFFQSRVELTDSSNDESYIVGRYLEGESQSPKLPDFPEHINRMVPVEEGFLSGGAAAVDHAITSDCGWAFLDEIGYLEETCPFFQDKLRQLFDTKQVLAVVRGQSLPFLNELKNRDDVYLLDLDHPFLSVGCVIMASGIGKRFGSNKLLANFDGKPLISHVLDLTEHSPFAQRIVVTRHAEIEELCSLRGIDVILHDLPGRNDTVRLGLSKILHSSGNDNSSDLTDKSDYAGCIFIPADQPLLTLESLETMILTFSHSNPDTICRLAGSPVLFGSRYFGELLNLPDGKGGGVLLAQYPKHVVVIPTEDSLELSDIDTPEDLIKLEKERK